MPASDPSNNATTPKGTASKGSETVCFALQSRVNYKKDKAYLAARKLAARIKIIGMIIGITLVMTGLYDLMGVRPSWSVLVLCFLGFVPFACWSAISERRWRRAYKGRLPLMAPEECRFCCIGAPGQLAEFGEWADVPFEPALFFGKFAIRGRGWPRWLYVGIATLVLVVWFGLGIRWQERILYTQGYLAFVFALGVAEVVTAFLWPTYLRLVPGRLDTLGYGPFSKKPIFLDRYDLRGAKIMADLRRSFVSIVPQNSPPGRPLEFGISLMSERRKFVFILFLAAMSTFEPGPVPEDDLVG